MRVITIHYHNLWLNSVHYYNYYANGWNWTTYPTPRMATEYGFQAMPSLHAWRQAADVDDVDDWTLNSTLLSARQHHPMGQFEMLLQVTSRMGPPRNATPLQEFQDFIYLTQVGTPMNSDDLIANRIIRRLNRCIRLRPSKWKRSTTADSATSSLPTVRVTPWLPFTGNWTTFGRHLPGLPSVSSIILSTYLSHSLLIHPIQS